MVSYKSAFEQNCSLTYLLSFSFAYVVTLATSRQRLMFGQIKSYERLSLETRIYRLDSALLPYSPSLVQIPIHTRNINIASHRRRSKAHAIKARKQQTPLKRSMNEQKKDGIYSIQKNKLGARQETPQLTSHYPASHKGQFYADIHNGLTATPLLIPN